LGSIVPHFLASAGYVHQFIFGGESTIIAPAWSLEVEVQFYILVPLLTRVFQLPRKVGYLVLFASMIGGSLATAWAAGSAIEPTLLYYLCFFLAGFVAANDYLTFREKRLDDQQSYLWDLIAIALLAFLWIPFEFASHIILPFALIALFRASFRSKVVSRILCNTAATTIGGMCYTIYLYHVVLIACIGRATKRLHFGTSFSGYFLLQTAIMLPIILIICAGFFLLIEKPCMDKNWPQKLRARIFPQAIEPPVALAQSVHGSEPN